ncbi:site-specific recombinase XerD [Streptomyces sp. TLI_235]|nr:site-specific integrase [Streptomyces sp. TLI_235]PBC66320.1 site-specific recombinase XerD [Streptomyces sp. TLI_235]
MPTGKLLTVRSAADVFLDSFASPSTARSYGIAVGRVAERLGEARPLASVLDDEIGEALELLWGAAAVNTWNARRAAVLSWLSWCGDRGFDGPAVPAWAKRRTVPDSNTPARSRIAIDRLIGRREIHLRERTLWWMLYETAARAEEILSVNIEDLDLPGRCGSVRVNSARQDFVLETVHWGAGTASLLSRLLMGRTRGPVFVTHRRAGPGKLVNPRDICPDTELTRLSYGRARALLDEHTSVSGPGTGWDLHEWRHSSLSHLGEAGASLSALKAKSRHRSIQNVRRYFKSAPEAISGAAGPLASGDGH